jgi:hypothetical protein
MCDRYASVVWKPRRADNKAVDAGECVNPPLP